MAVTTEQVLTNAAGLQRLLQLSSPILPVGAYSYSQGLEAAAEAGDVHDTESAGGWISGILRHSVARLEAPILVRLLAAWSHDDDAAVAHWNERFVASRESAELRAETLQMGYSMRTLVQSLELPGAERLSRIEALSWPAAWSFAAQVWRVAPAQALTGYLWAWAEYLVLAALKIVPLGQTDGQRLLLALSGPLVAAVRTASELRDDELGAFTPRLALLSARHESQYSRLFRS